MKLFYRSVLFWGAAAVYVFGRVRGETEPFRRMEEAHWLLALIWVVYAVEMLMRFFPSRTESMGSQRQFARNYLPTGETDPDMPPWQRTFGAAAAWFALNGAIGGLYFAGAIDRDILVLISLRCVRYDLHIVFLPIPDLDPQEQVLRSLQDLQLGLCHDVHSICVYTEYLHLEPAYHVFGTTGAMGDHPAYASRVVFGSDER